MQKYFIVVFFICLCYGSSLALEDDILSLPVLDYDDTNNYDLFWDAQYNLLKQEKNQEQKRTDQILKQLCENNDFTLKDILIDCENIKITPKIEKAVIKKRDVTEVLEEGSGDDAPEDHQVEENKETGSLTDQSISVKSALVETAPVDSAPVKPTPEESIKENPAPPDSTLVDSAPIETVQAKAEPVKTATEETATVEVVPVKASPIEAGPIKATPVEAAPIDAESIKASPVEAAPIDAESIEASPVKESSIETAPTEAEPIKASPLKESPVEAAPIKAAPVEVAVVKAAPVESVPEEAIPVKAAPVETAPVEAAAVEATPVEAVPVKAAPVEAAPVEAVPVKAAPVEAEPIKASPVKAAPVEATPVNVSPVDAAPVDAAPVGVVPVQSAPESSKTTGSVPEAVTIAIESVKETTKLLNKEKNEILEKDDMSSGSNVEENDEKNKGSKEKKGRKLTQEDINVEQSGVAVYKVDGGIKETDAKLSKIDTNESMKTASIGGVGESTEANAGGNDNKILITLFVGVLAVGVAAFSYNYIKKKKRTNDTSSRTKNGVVQSDPEEGAEMKPLVRENRPNVEYKNEKKEDAST